MSTVVLMASDERVTHAVSTTLRSTHTVHRAPHGRAVVSLAKAHSPCVIVLIPAGMGPGGLDECRTIRSGTDAPILVLGRAGGDEVDEVLAFASGADDYASQDISGRVLSARVNALIRRSHQSPHKVSIRTFGNVSMDLDQRRAHVDGCPLHLTRIEFELLLALTDSRHRVVSRSELVERVWGPWHSSHHVLEVHLSRLRTKILAAGGPRVGEAVPGYGYRLGGGTAYAV